MWLQRQKWSTTLSHRRCHDFYSRRKETAKTPNQQCSTADVGRLLLQTVGLRLQYPYCISQHCVAREANFNMCLSLENPALFTTSQIWFSKPLYIS